MRKLVDRLGAKTEADKAATPDANTPVH